MTRSHGSCGLSHQVSFTNTASTEAHNPPNPPSQRHRAENGHQWELVSARPSRLWLNEAVPKTGRSAGSPGFHQLIVHPERLLRRNERRCLHQQGSGHTHGKCSADCKERRCLSQQGNGHTRRKCKCLTRGCRLPRGESRASRWIANAPTPAVGTGRGVSGRAASGRRRRAPTAAGPAAGPAC